MAGGFGNSSLVLVRNQSSTDVSLVAMLASCSPVALQGGSLEDAMANCGQKRAYYAAFEDPGEEELADDYTQQVEKKRRLTLEQVRSLERSFEVDNKLEPERKMQLAKELGLQPRQVAVWFQNRRARWKIKQLERDYELLSSDFNRLKSDYDSVLQEKEELESERAFLTEKLRPEQGADLPERRAKRSNVPARVEGEVKTKMRSELDGAKAASSESISSELVDAESPRTSMDSDVLLPLDDLAAYPHCISAEMMDLGDQLLALHGCHRISVKLEDGSFQDDSCNYMLPHLDEERGLPWWDWP